MVVHLLNLQFNDLLKLLKALGTTAYTQKSAMLGDVTCGQHVRHIIELAQCMVQGYESGSINYDARKRDLRIETDTQFAMATLTELIDSTSLPDKSLYLVQNDGCRIQTYYRREVVYNTEHAIHHMALIRVALREMQLDLVGDHFGVAPSTLQYKKNNYA
jgi:hypothetical protein